MLAVFLYPREMQLLKEDIITEEEVLAQIAWDICKGFLNIKVEPINMDSVKNAGISLRKTGLV